MSTTDTEPSSCGVCGKYGPRDHGQCVGLRGVPLHHYVEPTDAQRKERMLARRDARRPVPDTERDERLREALAMASSAAAVPLRQATPAAQALDVLAAEVARQAAVIQAVRDYHATGCLIPGCSDCAKVCRGCGLRTPCPTVRALDGGA